MTETSEAVELPEWFLRRSQIIALLEVMNQGLPEPMRRDHSTSGFVNDARYRSCPDCLANGRVMFGCETCGGSGEVRGAQIAALALTDQLPDDGQRRDPYAMSETVVAYGVRDTRKLGHAPERDAEIARLDEQTREPFENTEEEIGAANRSGGYVWERERHALRKRFDIDAMTAALEVLRDRDEAGYHLLHSVYVYGWSEPSTTMQAAVERALVFLDGRLPNPLRAPGVPREKEHPAASRVRANKQRRAA